MTQGNALTTKNYILTHQKINLSDQNIFSSETEVKKYFFKIGQ